MIDLTIRNVDRLFVLSFENGGDDSTRNPFVKYYMPLIKIKDFNVLKALRQLVWRKLLWWKDDLDWNTCLISMFSKIFIPYERVLVVLSRKQAANFPCLYSQISLCCHFRIFKMQQSFSERPNLQSLNPWKSDKPRWKALAILVKASYQLCGNSK